MKYNILRKPYGLFMLIVLFALVSVSLVIAIKYATGDMNFTKDSRKLNLESFQKRINITFPQGSKLEREVTVYFSMDKYGKVIMPSELESGFIKSLKDEKNYRNGNVDDCFPQFVNWCQLENKNIDFVLVESEMSKKTKDINTRKILVFMKPSNNDREIYIYSK